MKTPMNPKTEPEQMRLIEESTEEKIHRLRGKVADTEGIYRTLEKASKVAKERLVEFVLENMDGDAFAYSDDNVASLNAVASNCRSIEINMIEAKAAIGDACRELAEAERSR